MAYGESNGYVNVTDDVMCPF